MLIWGNHNINVPYCDIDLRVGVSMVKKYHSLPFYNKEFIDNSL